MQNKSKLDELLDATLKESTMNEDEVKVYGADDEDQGDDMDMGYDDDEEVVDLDAEDEDDEGENDLDDLIAQLKDIVDELEDMEVMDSDGDLDLDDAEEKEDEGEFGDDEADLEFGDDEEEMEEGSCDKKEAAYEEDLEEDLEEDVVEEASEKPSEADAAVGKAKPLPKAGGAEGAVSDSDVDDEEAAKEVASTVKGSGTSASGNAAAKPGNKLSGKEGAPTLASTGEGGTGKQITMEDVEVDLSKEIKAIMNMDSTLSESAQKKTAKLFENAVNKKASIINKQLSEQYSALFEERVEQFQDELVAKIDEYLDYVVENYMTENQLAIEEGLKVRVSSSFLEGLSALFEEHYVSVPEGKVDLVEKLESEIESAEAKNNELYEHAIKLRRENIELRKDRAVRKLSEDLSVVETSKFKKLIEGVEYKNQKQFIEAIEAVKATHFTESVAAQEPQEFETLAEETKQTAMDSYLNAIRKFK